MLSRKITVDHRYLILPVSRRQKTGHMRLLADGVVVRWFDIALAEGIGDYRVFSDLQPYLGKRLTVEYTGAGPSSLDGVATAVEPASPEELYREQLRPQFHFSSRRGWNNDPNGLVYLDGEYHLLYQHNPYSTEWGNLHWGHAVSRDLVNWTELPVALYPDHLGAMSTGCAVVDHHNTAGFADGGGPAIVAIYTAGHASWVEDFVQCLAFSTDRGRSWTKYDGNPVIGHIVGRNRDPKVIWHPDTERWIMALYMEGNDYALFASPNLREWDRLSDMRLPRTTECPEMFPLAVNGNPDDIRWVFWGANTTYLVGSFDGRTFQPQQPARKLQPDGRSYAAQTWSGIPDSDGRRIQIAWMRQTLPGMPFGQFMTVPYSLGLARRDEGLVLTATPVSELEQLRVEEWEAQDIELPAGARVEAEMTGELLDVEVEIELREADAAGLIVRGVPVWYNQRLGGLFCGAYTAPLSPPDGPLHLRVLVDRASVEVFTDGGATMISGGMVLLDGERSVHLFASGGSAVARRVRVSRLRSAWPI